MHEIGGLDGWLARLLTVHACFRRQYQVLENEVFNMEIKYSLDRERERERQPATDLLLQLTGY
jgi:hypothetical protein